MAAQLGSALICKSQNLNLHLRNHIFQDCPPHCYLNWGGTTGDPLDLILGAGGLRFGPGCIIGDGGGLLGGLRPNSMGMMVLPKKPPEEGAAGVGVGRPTLIVMN